MVTDLLRRQVWLQKNLLICWWCEEKMAMERTHCARRTCKYLWCVCVVMQTCHIITLHMHLYQTHIFGVYIYIYIDIYIYILRAYWNVGWLEGLVVWSNTYEDVRVLWNIILTAIVLKWACTETTHKDVAYICNSHCFPLASGEVIHDEQNNMQRRTYFVNECVSDD